jgi:SAM-dependent methyltransferase
VKSLIPNKMFVEEISRCGHGNGMSQPEFDAFAQDYDAALQQGLRFTGEDRWYYARGRCSRLAKSLHEAGHKVGRILDFGCGTGTATRCLQEAFPGAKVIGTDPSEESLRVAREDHRGLECAFVTADALAHEEGCDLAYCNGVFHHIPVEERAAAVDLVWRALKPGGYFALWENNPWNPAVWFVMSRVPFDKDAILLWPRETRARLRQAGFEIVHTRSWFVFPGALKFLRPLEPALSPLPLGGQYVVLARKPR